MSPSVTGLWSETDPKKDPVYTPAEVTAPWLHAESSTWSMRLVGMPPR